METSELRERIKTLAAELGKGTAPDVVGRALLVEGADRLMAADGPLSASRAVARVQDLMSGFWVPENVQSFIESRSR